MNTIMIYLSLVIIIIFLFCICFILLKTYFFIKDIALFNSQTAFSTTEIDRRTRLKYITLLNSSLELAVKQERFEDAQQFKKIIEKEMKSFEEDFDN